ncbi:MAG TPA: aminopeptidase P family protein [Bacteroidales bacterium]|nr:aminopeptidase P family protein [Bacteroidales bacterium]
MKKNQIPERLSDLRKFMESKNLNVFVIPSTDPHLSEYPAAIWESRKWISGFTGSAGTIVVSLKEAGLFTDSRYFLQGVTELENTGIDLFKMGLPETPDMIDWIISQAGENGKVGIDGLVYAAADAQLLENRLKRKNIELVTEHDPFAEIWKDRPEIPTNEIFTLSEDVTGESTKSKIKRIVAALKKEDADSMIMVTLDTIAWTFNIRGNDVNFNPVAVAYAYISEKETVLFINPKKLTVEVAENLKQQGVTLADYHKIFDYVGNLTANETVLVTGSKINRTLLQTIPAHCSVIDVPSPADLMKSKKNKTELKGFRNAMLKDGLALVKFYMWMEKAVPAGEVTEITIDEKLREYRSQQPLYFGESFSTIAGYKGNGAIVHYRATPENHLKVDPEGLMLIDSGAQFMDGTTDITRTLAVGPLTEQMKKDYTNVLKGHIQIATAIYPQGTRGSQLDVLARKALWDNCLHYSHGTGHGIGHFLNVHEGPQNIRLEENPVTLQPGMVTSNEPGLYRADEYGIRIENLIITQEYNKNEFGAFYNFETITLCHIDTTPIVKELLTDKEVEWLNNYHTMVFEKLSPHLNEEEKAWLKEKTKHI